MDAEHEQGTLPDRGPAAVRRRRAQVLDLVRAHGQVGVADLAARLPVSAETLRRDLRALEEGGLVLRRYGEVSVVESSTFETTLASRTQRDVEEKRRIAAEAARRLEGVDTLFLDEGWLPSLVVEHLPTGRDLTVLTTSLSTATALTERSRVTAYMIGGRIRPATLGAVDDWAVRMVRAHAPDLAVLGANAVSPDGWVTTPDPAVAAVKSAALESAAQRILVAGHRKFGRSTFARFARLDDFDTVITGRELTSGQARVYGAHRAELVRV